jgi:hypothetical protein
MLHVSLSFKLDNNNGLANHMWFDMHEGFKMKNARSHL